MSKASFETIVRPFVNEPAVPRRLLQRSVYTPNIVQKIGKSGGGKSYDIYLKTNTTWYRDRHEEEK